MLYIVSQNKMRIADLHTVSVVTPEHDREEEEVYKIYINGIEFARYGTMTEAVKALEEIKMVINRGIDGTYELPKGRVKDGENK